MTAERFYIVQLLMDTESGQALSTEVRACAEGEVPWVRDSRMHAQIAWCAFLNKNPVCAIPYLHKQEAAS